MMGKKGELMAQPFLYILGAVMLVLVFVFGAQQILKLQKLGDDVEYVKFKEILSQDIDGFLSYDVGSTKIFETFVPQKVSQVCFAKSGKLGISVSEEFTLRHADGDTVFLLPFSSNSQYSSFRVAGMSVEKNPLCLKPVAGKLKALFEVAVVGKQTAVVVKETQTG